MTIIMNYIDKKFNNIEDAVKWMKENPVVNRLYDEYDNFFYWSPSNNTVAYDYYYDIEDPTYMYEDIYWENELEYVMDLKNLISVEYKEIYS